MDILIAAGESVPFCKTGGLADVVGALTQSLSRMGHRVCLFLPCYRSVEGGGHSLRSIPGQFWIPIGDATVTGTLMTTTWGAATVYFIRNQKYFSRDGLYQEGGKDYPDNDERFVFFSRAVLEAAKFVDFRPDVVHVHDWQAALIPAYLKTLYRIDAYFSRTGSLLTIHNIAYQGMFPKDALFLAGFGWSDFTPERLEYYGGLNFLKAGLVFADRLTTVSPTYAAEIRTSEEFGRGMEGLLRHRAGDLSGILNGLDVDVWNPETDPFLVKNYGREDAREGKAANKAALVKECGLAASEKSPLVGIVSRLDPQKGLDVALSLIPKLAGRGIPFAVLGMGYPVLQKGFAAAAAQHPKAVHFHSSFDEPFAHRLYAAADLLLMPSRFEPCGLGQMIAMRYGALPVVTRTGGLADTVSETASAPASGPRPNGFVADRCAPEEVGAALERALAAYGNRPAWQSLMGNAMAQDCSWERSAKEYLELYRKVASLRSA